MDVDKVCFIVKLGNSYLINPLLIGKTISFSFEDTSISPKRMKCELLFPCRSTSDKFFLVQPQKDIGMDLDAWGRIEYSGTNEIPHVEAVVIEITGDNQSINTGKVKKEVSLYTDKILKIIRCLYPYSLKRNKTKNLVNNLYLQTISNGKPCIETELNFCFESDAPQKWVEIEGIVTAIKNSKRKLSLVRSLFDNALDYESENDYRACVLNCATLIEILMKQSLEKGIRENVCNQKLANKLIEKADGYDKIRSNLELLSLNPRIEANPVFKIRNAIIHKGYMPKAEKVKEILNIAKEMISFYHVAFFEE